MRRSATTQRGPLLQQTTYPNSLKLHRKRIPFLTCYTWPSMSQKRYFNLHEANAQLCDLTDRFHLVIQLRAQCKLLRQRLYSASFAAATGAPSPQAREQIKREQILLYGLDQVLKEELRSIRALGCVIKDIDQGLVNWPAIHGSTEIHLCWQYGDGEIRYWQNPNNVLKPISELQ